MKSKQLKFVRIKLIGENNNKFIDDTFIGDIMQRKLKKALILAGGKGSRLYPMTLVKSKQLMPIANKPIINYVVESLIKVGIEEFNVIISPHTKEEIIDNFTKSFPNHNFNFIIQTAPLGLAHTIQIANIAGHLTEDDNFIMYLGDNLLLEDLSTFVNKFKSNGANAKILLKKVNDPTKFGIAYLDGEKVIKLVEKPKNSKSNLALVGIYIFDGNIIKAVNNIKASTRGELEITDAIQWLLDNKLTIKYSVVKKWWKDIGSKNAMLEANRLVLNERTRELEVDEDKVGSNTIYSNVLFEDDSLHDNLNNSEIRGPSIIGKNVIIKDSYIGPYSSIGDNCIIENSIISNSIVLENTIIKNVNHHLDSCIIGENCEIIGDGKFNKDQLILSNNSYIRLSKL